MLHETRLKLALRSKFVKFTTEDLQIVAEEATKVINRRLENERRRRIKTKKEERFTK